MIRRQEQQRILVLQGQRCCWSLWRGDVCVEHRAMTMRSDDAELDADAVVDDVTDPFACPWPADGDCSVDVIVDSPHDEIDQVMSRDHLDHGDARPVLGLLQRRWLAMSLRRRYPDAAIRLVNSTESSVLASVLRTELPSIWQRNLVDMQGASALVRQLFSALRLRRPVREKGSVLQIVSSGDAERHTVYLDGCPIFTRHITIDSEDARTQALIETCEHVTAQHAIDEPHIERVNDENGLHVARLALNSPRERLGGDVVEPQRTRRENRRLRLFTGLTAAIAGVAVISALVHGVDSARERARAIAAQDAAKARVATLRRQVNARHETPARALASLSLIDSQRSHASPAPDDVLRRLADVLTQHPDIAVERLAWNSGVAVDGGAGDAIERVRSPAALSLLPLDTRSRAMDGTDQADGPRGIIALEMSGRIVVDSPAQSPRHVDEPDVAHVGDRQKRFAAFLDALEQQTMPDGLVVDLSPAMAASRGQNGGQAAGTDYAVRLHFATAG